MVPNYPSQPPSSYLCSDYYRAIFKGLKAVKWMNLVTMLLLDVAMFDGCGDGDNDGNE